MSLIKVTKPLTVRLGKAIAGDTPKEPPFDVIGPVPNAFTLPAIRVELFMFVPPVYELLPVSVNTPAPD